MENELGNPKWIGIARTYLMDIASGKIDDAVRVLAPEVSYRVMGHHALSGEFSGRDGVATHIAEIVAETDGRFDPVKFVDWMLGLNHVSIIIDVEVEVGVRSQRLRHMIVMRFNREDRVDEANVFFSDLDAAERIYGRKPAP